MPILQKYGVSQFIKPPQAFGEMVPIIDCWNNWSTTISFTWPADSVGFYIDRFPISHEWWWCKVFSLAAILTTALVKVSNAKEASHLCWRHVKTCQESYGFMIAKFVRIWQVVVHAFLVTKMYRGLWRADRRHALLESFTFGLGTFHAAPGMLTPSQSWYIFD